MRSPIQLNSEQKPAAVEIADFERAAKTVLSRLRVAVGKLVHSAPAEIGRTVDLQRALGLEWSVAWQVFRLAGVTDPFDAVAVTPGPGLMSKVFRAARERGFSAPAVEEAEAAYEEFVRFVKQHARDRDSFDAMVATLGGKASPQIDMKLRRSAYRVNSQVWGVHAKVVYDCLIYCENSHAEIEPLVYVSELLGLQRLREIPPIPFVKRIRMTRKADEELAWRQQATLGWQGFVLMPEFCSKPTPVLESVVDEETSLEMLRLDGIGRTSETTCSAYSVLHTANDGQAGGWQACRVNTLPAETAIVDVLVPKGLADLGTLQATTYGKIGDAQAPGCLIKSREGLEMPVHEAAQHLGTSLDALYDRDLPRCADMVRQAVEGVGWGGVEFDIFRCKIKYPILFSAIDLRINALNR